MPFRRFDHGLELSDLARSDHAVSHSDRAVSRSDRAVASTDPMIAPLDLEVARIEGEHALARGAIRQDDWLDGPPYPGMRSFDAQNTPF